MILRRFTEAGRRARAATAAPVGPVRDVLEAPAQEPSTHSSQLRLLAIDLETTGLDPAKDSILAVGFVPVDGPDIVLGGARHLVRNGDVEVGQSATVHGITDDRLRAGLPLGELVLEVCRAAVGRVLVAHYSRIETEFLSAACEQQFGVPLPLKAVDTMDLQRRVLGDSAGDGAALPQGALRLWAARERFGLPVYGAHEALTDAIACAELYLAQVDHLSAGAGMTLKALRR